MKKTITSSLEGKGHTRWGRLQGSEQGWLVPYEIWNPHEMKNDLQYPTDKEHLFIGLREKKRVWSRVEGIKKKRKDCQWRLSFVEGDHKET